MTKFHKKLLVFLSVLVCTLCLCFGLAACNPSNDDNTNEDDGHTHNFAGAWLYDGAEGHYQLATCHPTVKSELQDHFDDDENGKCDACGFDMSSEDDEHQHTYKDEWSFNEKKHWHDASCDHFIERSEYNDHDFVAGVCECGVKESQVKVYDLYRNSPEYDLEFVDWLDWLKDNGIISVEFTASGDGIYHYEDGSSEVRFLGERTVKVKAVVDGDPLTDVWFMVAMYQTAEEGYYENKGTIALGIAKTDATGVAEITFRPAGGYSSEAIEYRIRIAEKKDIAVFESVTEENASLPFPNRYLVKGGNEGFEYKPYEVSENATSDDIAATIEFVYSKGWNAYNTIYLPYRRYWTDQLNGTDIQEVGTTYNFTSSGDNLFDYLYFSPQQYDYKQGGTEEKNLQIVENAKIACSGVYTITFTVDRNANAELYYWNEEGVNLGAFHYTNPDGTPSNMYLTEKSGENNFVTVTISTAEGLRYYQLGIKTDIECNVTMTVERTGDIGFDGTFEWDTQTNKSQITVDIRQDDTMTFDLNGVPEGTYVLEVSVRAFNSYTTRYYTWTDDDEQKIYVWAPKTFNDRYGVPQGIIRITEDTNFIFLQNKMEQYKGATITLEKYELPTVELDEFVTAPVTPATYDISYTLPLSISAGSYNLGVYICGWANRGADIPLSVYIGETKYELTEPVVYIASGTYYYTYTGTVEIGEQDTTFSIRCVTTEYLFTAGVEIKQIEEPEPEDDLIHEFEGFTISAGATIDLTYLYFVNYVKGYAYLVAETDTTPENGKLVFKYTTTLYDDAPYDMFMPVVNQFKVRFDTSKYVKLKLQNTSGSDIVITSLKLMKYEEPTIEAGVDCVIQSIDSMYLVSMERINFSPELIGKKVTITISNWATDATFPPEIYRGKRDDDFVYFTEDDKIADGVYQVTVTIPAGETVLKFENFNEHFRNIVVRFDIVES
ncbi:MAG: hypothetical protein J1F61_05735 [Clostridiales bacterium]|nr:hypothetical protein [Clostridiales bacterium]